MGILAEISHNVDSLPPIQKKIAKYIIQFPKDVVRMSISRLAEETGAKSEASIVKFYRSLGCSGYHDFKVSLATEIAGRTFQNTDTDSPITMDDDIPTIRNKIFNSAIHILDLNNHHFDDKTIEQVVNTISNSKRVVILGYGTSAVIAYDLYVKLSRLGYKCHYTFDTHVTALTLSEPSDGDVVFAVSFSGESKDIVYQCRSIKGFAPIIALTGEKDSPLAKTSDICITVQSYETTYHTDAMISRMVQLAVIDVIFTALAVNGGNKSIGRLTRARQGLSFLKF